MAPKAVCSRCGAVYRGWALVDMGIAECKECGARLDIDVRPREQDGSAAQLVTAGDGHTAEQPTDPC